MRLKVSSKEALKVVDNLVAKGYKLSRDPYFAMVSDKDKLVEEWFDEARVALRHIFFDAVPLYRVLKCRAPKERSFSLYLYKKNEIPPEKDLEKALDVLVEYYDYFVSQDKSPVKYLAEKSEIWLYDFCCKLEPESNEAELCKYMFQFGIGAFQEMAEIHKHITGEEYDPKAKDKNVVVNALDGVNRKTNEIFKFPLFEKKKSVVALSIPSRLVLDIKS